MRGVSGVRLHNLLLSSHGHTPEPTPISLAEKILNALRDVEEISRARADLAMEKIRDALRWAQRQLSSQGETSELRQWVTRASLQVRALKSLIISRARRLLNVKSATRLRHMAEQEWERFNADCPPGSTRYSRSEWTLRRGRRLSVLEKHTAELKAAQERASEGELNAIDAEILTKAELLAALPHPSQAVAPTLAEPKQVASSVLGSVPSVPEGQRSTDPVKNKPRECGATVQWGPVPTDGFRAGSGFAGGRPRDARQASGEGKLIGTWLRSTLAACDTVLLVGA